MSNLQRFFIALCKNFIINIDELSVMSKTDVNILKAFIFISTLAKINYGKIQI